MADFDFSEIWKVLGGMTGGGIRAGATAYGGYETARAADVAAEGLDSAGGQYVAASQLKAQNELRRTKLMTSRAQQLAAASGAGASDPTVVDIISGIAGEGAYRSELALYEGKEQQRAMAAKADAMRYQGASAQAAGYVNAITGFGKTFFEKYGAGGPRGTMSNGSGAWDTTDYGGGNAYNIYGAGP